MSDFFKDLLEKSKGIYLPLMLICALAWIISLPALIVFKHGAVLVAPVLISVASIIAGSICHHNDTNRGTFKPKAD